MSDNAEPTQPSEPEEAPVELRCNNQANDTNSSTTSYDSEEDDMVHSLRASATTVGFTNRTTRDNTPRGNSSSSSSRRSKKERHERRKKSKGNSGTSPLRTKFQIESLHLQIFELKKQNEFLKCLLVEAQQHSPSRHQLEVPSTVQVSSDTTNNTDESDLDSSNRGKDEMNMEFNQLSFTKEEDEMNMEFNQLSCA